MPGLFVNAGLHRGDKRSETRSRLHAVGVIR